MSRAIQCKGVAAGLTLTTLPLAVLIFFPPAAGVLFSSMALIAAHKLACLAVITFTLSVSLFITISSNRLAHHEMRLLRAHARTLEQNIPNHLNPEEAPQKQAELDAPRWELAESQSAQRFLLKVGGVPAPNHEVPHLSLQLQATELQNAQARVTQLEEQLALLTQQQEQTTTAGIGEATSALAKTQIEIEGLKKAVQQMETAKGDAQATAGRYLKERDALRGQIADLESKRKCLTSELEVENQRIRDLTGKHGEALNKIGGQEKQIEKTGLELLGETKRADEANTQRSERVSYFEAEITRLRENIQQIEEERDLAKAHAGGILQTLDESQKAIKELEREKQIIDLELKSARQGWAELTGKLTAAEAQIEERAVTIAHMESEAVTEAKTLVQQQREYDQKIQNLTESLEVARKAENTLQACVRAYEATKTADNALADVRVAQKDFEIASLQERITQINKELLDKRALLAESIEKSRFAGENHVDYERRLECARVQNGELRAEFDALKSVLDQVKAGGFVIYEQYHITASKFYGAEVSGLIY